jgi:hypothetical protein
VTKANRVDCRNEGNAKMEIEELVAKAQGYINSIYGEAASALMLEELQRSEDEQKWLITVSFSRKQAATSTLSPLLVDSNADQFERVYKQIQIDAQSGEFLGMTMRQV